MATQIIPAVDRFMKFISPEPNTGCWLWFGPLSGGTGYGSFWMNGGNIGAHRAAVLLLLGPIPQGLAVLHRCDQRHCCNPDHLFLGTKQENNIDMARKGRGSKSRSLSLPYGVTRNNYRPNEPHPYRAQIRMFGKRHYLGSFSSAADAGCVAAKAKEALLAAEGRK